MILIHWRWLIVWVVLSSVFVSGAFNNLMSGEYWYIALNLLALAGCWWVWGFLGAWAYLDVDEVADMQELQPQCLYEDPQCLQWQRDCAEQREE